MQIKVRSNTIKTSTIVLDSSKAFPFNQLLNILLFWSKKNDYRTILYKKFCSIINFSNTKGFHKYLNDCKTRKNIISSHD